MGGRGSRRSYESYRARHAHAPLLLCEICCVNRKAKLNEGFGSAGASPSRPLDASMGGRGSRRSYEHCIARGMLRCCCAKAAREHGTPFLCDDPFATSVEYVGLRPN